MWGNRRRVGNGDKMACFLELAGVFQLFFQSPYSGISWNVGLQLS